MTQMIYVIGFVVFVLIIGYFGAKKEAEVVKAYQERTKAESDARIAEAKKEEEVAKAKKKAEGEMKFAEVKAKSIEAETAHIVELSLMLKLLNKL